MKTLCGPVGLGHFQDANPGRQQCGSEISIGRGGKRGQYCINNNPLTGLVCVNTIIAMKISFDHAKDVANTSKHGVSLADAAGFEWDGAIYWPDTRRDYGEARMVAIGYIGQRLFCVVYVDRVHSRRIISLRKANTREARHYAST